LTSKHNSEEPRSRRRWPSHLPSGKHAWCEGIASGRFWKSEALPLPTWGMPPPSLPSRAL